MFTPNNRPFYQAFDDMALHVWEMAGLLDILVKEADKESRSKHVQEIIRLESVCDEISHALSNRLGKSFFMPLDREDVYFLANTLDDVADYIFSSAKEIDIYHIDPIDEGIQQLAALTLQATQEIKKGMAYIKDLRKAKHIMEHVHAITKIEKTAGNVFDASLDNLLTFETDFKKFIKRRELYQTMEEIADKCKHVANILESIVIKYA